MPTEPCDHDWITVGGQTNCSKCGAPRGEP